MALKLQFAFNEGATLEAIIMDATLSEGHSFASDVTDFPVEKGSAITDNSRPKPTQLRIDAFIADFPLPSTIVQQFVSGQAVQSILSPKRSQNALDKLIKLKDEGVLITVTTGIRTYQNMLIQSIDVNRDKNIAAGIRMTISMREIITVQTQTAQIVAAEAKGQGKQSTGPKTGKGTTTSEANSASLAAQVFDGVTK